MYLYLLKGGVIALNGSSFQSYGASPAVLDHTVNAPRLNPSQISRCLIYLARNGRLS